MHQRQSLVTTMGKMIMMSNNKTIFSFEKTSWDELRKVFSLISLEINLNKSRFKTFKRPNRILQNAFDIDNDELQDLSFSISEMITSELDVNHRGFSYHIHITNETLNDSNEQI